MIPETEAHFLTYLPAEYTALVAAAAGNTGFRVYADSPHEGRVGVYTAEEATRDHSRFWAEYDALKKLVDTLTTVAQA